MTSKYNMNEVLTSKFSQLCSKEIQASISSGRYARCVAVKNKNNMGSMLMEFASSTLSKSLFKNLKPEMIVLSLVCTGYKASSDLCARDSKMVCILWEVAVQSLNYVLGAMSYQGVIWRYFSKIEARSIFLALSARIYVTEEL